MSEFHLKELEKAFSKLGWRISEVLDGDGYRISATWKIERGMNEIILIDFEGMHMDRDYEVSVLSLDKSYGCKIRGHGALSIYFSASRKQWFKDLKIFSKAFV